MWLLRAKLGLTPSNRHLANSTHIGKVRRLGIRNKRMVDDPHDSRRENELITGHRISIDIYERENEVKRKVYSKFLNEGKQKVSMRLGNGVIMRQRMEGKCHHHV